ncbi:15820_t:CDS:2 [Cetraspora pellucida]|uniref:15820_t:CDS:1 n=1 Tax=Cetraspora pellucida TaxID=1433469 RepID=A0A9N9APG9_9GLOM|nr:15820_t:CDS:2 [Cetraspora pellucida]
MDAANQIARFIWNKGGYMAKCIQIWRNYFIKTEELLPYHQSKHTKLESLINDEDFSEDCIEWLRQQKPEVCTPSNLKAYIENTLFSKLIGHIKEDTISEKTCRNYMYSWGFKYNERRKGIFFDGHERPDVLVYRNKWLKKMFMYKKNMKDFVGENILRPKHLGRSKMVSAFLCPCHELLCLTDQQLYENPYIKDKETFVIHSVQIDGYWKAEHMLEQLVSKVIPVFEILHSGCIGMFCFDQFTNHNAMAEDALIAKKMNLSSGEKQPMMQNGWFIDETGKKCVQPMVFPNDYQKEALRGKQKCLRQVLEERKLWSAEKVLLVCEKCSRKCTDNGPEKLDCCAQRIMSLQHDFLEQWSLLEEAVINARHIFECYPKFHCELNLVLEVLKSVSVITIRKFSHKSWRYMDAYDKGLKGVAAEWAVNQYKSHCRILKNIEQMME